MQPRGCAPRLHRFEQLAWCRYGVALASKPPVTTANRQRLQRAGSLELAQQQESHGPQAQPVLMQMVGSSVNFLE